MDKQRHNELRDYLRWLANEMGLRDWTVSLSANDFAGGESAADIVCLYGRKYLTVRLCRTFDEEPLGRQRHWLVHELVHAHLWSLDFTINNIEHHLPASTFDLLQKCLNDQMEFAVDALAEVIAPHMPLPTPAKAKKKSPAPKPSEQEAA